MFSLTLSRTGLSARFGRAFVRTWRPYAWLLPSGYIEPELACLVEWHDERDGSVSQLGAFTTQETAEACIARLEADGWTDLVVNFVSVHERLVDWEHDR